MEKLIVSEVTYQEMNKLGFSRDAVDSHLLRIFGFSLFKPDEESITRALRALKRNK